jgi:hypothetical protein
VVWTWNVCTVVLGNAQIQAVWESLVSIVMCLQSRWLEVWVLIPSGGRGFSHIVQIWRDTHRACYSREATAQYMHCKFSLTDTCVAAAHASGFTYYIFRLPVSPRFSWNTHNATGILWPTCSSSGKVQRHLLVVWRYTCSLALWCSNMVANTREIINVPWIITFLEHL